MFKPSEFDISGVEELGEGSSEKDSNNSRDVNLNSKKFADCNLLQTPCKNGEIKNVELDVASFPTETVSSTEANLEIPGGNSNETEGTRRKEYLDSNQKNKSEPIHSTKCTGTNVLIKATNSSTPKLQSTGSPMACSLISAITLDANTEEDDSEKTYLITKSFPNRNPSLSDEEIGKKFQDLSFAFKTDSMTIRERLHLLKRKRDQDELNIENELQAIKSKLESLAVNSEYLNLISDLKKQLDFVRNAAIQLSSSAESYGYTQHEERSLEFVSVMLQHVENLQNNESPKMLKKLKGDSKRSQTTSSLDSENDEERIQRRRSLATVPLEVQSRRRASIATLPRSSMVEVGSNGNRIPWTSLNRTSSSASKKLSFSQKPSSRAYISSSPGVEETTRDSVTPRRRSDSRTSESMQEIEERPERRIATDSDKNLFSQVDAVDSMDESSFHLRQMYESVEDLRQSSMSPESISVLYCLRRIVEWNKLVLSATRFRWPDQVLHYVPFYITWYIVFVLALVFIGGLFTGINGCYTYSRLQYSLAWLAVLTFLLVVRRFYRVLLLFFLLLLFALILFVFWLRLLLSKLSDEEIDKLFRSFGLVVEVRYLHGPPPV